MTEVDHLLSKFIDAWNGGERPSVRGYLELVGDDRDRTELAGQITMFLDVAPIPPYPPRSLDDARDGRIVDAAVAAFSTEASGWATLLPRWRAAAGLTLEQLADCVLESAGLVSANRQKVAGYLGSMERGAMDARTTSRHAMSAVANALGVNVGDLVLAGQSAGAAAAGPLFRSVGDDASEVGDKLAALTDALLAPGTLDPVDQFFLGP
jgi:hypothetical protein